ncbi:MAG: hypothetical protein ACK5AZ_03885 [Bryobacteraceae bacterium]
MNHSGEGRALLAEACRGLEQAQRLLSEPAPESIEACAPLFEEIVRALTPLGEAGGPRLPAAELERFERELGRVRALFAHSARFHLVWARLAGLSGDSYGRSGEEREVEAPSRVVVEG